jgi:transposase
MTKPRNFFSSSFKFKIASAALREEKTINEIASENGVHPSQVAQWKSTLIESGSMVFDRKNGKAKETSVDVDELQRIVGEQTIKLNWYKKKLGIAN